MLSLKTCFRFLTSTDKTRKPSSILEALVEIKELINPIYQREPFVRLVLDNAIKEHVEHKHLFDRVCNSNLSKQEILLLLLFNLLVRDQTKEFTGLL